MRIERIVNGLKTRLLTAQAEKRDYHTKRHIVVFESDDWGSIRMSDRKSWESLLKLGYAVDKRPYERFDTLESPADLEALFEVLSRHKGADGNHPVITANMLVANPDFEKIQQSGYRHYYYEPISQTYTRYFGDAKALDIMRQGMEAGVFMPQSHGREHFNVNQWIRGLQAGNEDLLTAFNYGMCGIAPKANPMKGNQLMKALYASSDEEQKQIDGIVSEGVQMFEDIWGFKSKTFVAPCYCWSEQTESVLSQSGVKMIQASRVNKPAFQSGERILYTGQRNNTGIVYSIRNCRFEPATDKESSSVDALMKQVESTFANDKVAVFSTHRINYVSGIETDNRARTLALLDKFLTELLKRYPDTAFLSSDSLAEIYENKD